MGRLCGLAAPPGGDVRQAQRLAEQDLAEARQEGGEGGCLEQPGAWRIGDHDIAGNGRVDQPGHADRRMRIECQWIKIARIEAMPQRIHPLQPGDGADIDAIVEHREIGAFDHQEAKIAREMGLLGIAGGEPAGGEQRHARLGAAAGGGDAVAEGGEERRVALDIEPALQPAQRPRHRQPILQRIAGTGRGAKMVRQHAPMTIRAAAHIEGDEMEMVFARRRQVRERAQEERAAGE